MKITIKRLETKELLTLETEAQDGAQLRADIINKLGFNPNLEIIYKGLFLKNNESVLYLENKTVLVIRWRTDTPTATETENVSGTYTGEEVTRVLRYSGDVVFNLLHGLSQKDPYILSYLAVNPNKAREEILKYLSMPDFILNINASGSSYDPINIILSVDKNNIQYLAETSGFTDNERVKELYYVFNKDIKQTLDALLLERK
jgi:hypothetical protein